jgi:hypothetical protein
VAGAAEGGGGLIVGGWLDWAERVPYPSWKVNGGVNAMAGVVAHSAEGYEPYLRDYARDQTRRASWPLSNLYSGHLLQHYPLTAQCWASGATFPNNSYVAIESEGVAGERLRPPQVATFVRVVREISAVKHWRPARGVSLWEHREATRWGAPATACPSGRYPWAEILAALAGPEPAPEGEGEMRIIGLADRPEAYLVVGAKAYHIPDGATWYDLRALIYGEPPHHGPDVHHVRPETWAWLRDNGIIAGLG